jgi:tripartite-type tricarboxylate transporter receptor subunit TctC
MNRRKFLASTLSLAASSSFAQSYPTRNINLVVPFAAGGNTDVVARIIADHMAQTLGQPIIIENNGGAGGTSATARVAKTNPDGYTILIGQMGTHAAAVGVYDNLAYDPLTSFDPIGQVTDTPIIVIARKDFPANTLAELIALLKQNPDKYNFAHAGLGSISYSAALLFTSLTGAKAGLIPYRGSGPAFNDVMAGQVDLITDQIVHSSQHIRAGTVKAFAIATQKRAKVLPDLPTAAEAGLPSFLASGWNALYAPSGVPKAIRESLTNALYKALDDSEIKRRLEELGAYPVEGVHRGSAALAKFNKAEIDKWVPVLRAINKAK